MKKPVTASGRAGKEIQAMLGPLGGEAPPHAAFPLEQRPNSNEQQ